MHQAMVKLQRQRAPTWMHEWLALEYTGRSRNFVEQARLLNVVLKQRGASSDWPFVACLQSLEQRNIDTAPLHEVLRQYPELPSMGQILAVRLGVGTVEDAFGTLRSIPTDSIAYPPALYQLINLQGGQGQVREVLLSLDALAQTGHIDKHKLNTWLSLCVSHPAGGGHFLSRIRYAAQIVPPETRTLGIFASYSLIHHWTNARYADAYAVVKQFHGFMDLPNTDDDRMSRIFFGYVLLLAVAWQNNRALYGGDIASVTLNVVGESHSLSPANAVFDWNGNRVKARACFVMGIKMYHLAHEAPSSYKTCVLAYLDAAEINSHLLFTIGEIDCRPDDGIWNVHRKNGRPLEEIMVNTVDSYLHWLEKHLTKYEFASITLQGVPAPNYALTEKRDPGDREGFLAMIREVNNRLKDGALVRGWNFLDVYTATVNQDGTSNRQWHLDGYHLQPSFYAQAEKWLCRPIRTN